jgi:hypothetical protein
VGFDDGSREGARRQSARKRRKRLAKGDERRRERGARARAEAEPTHKKDPPQIHAQSIARAWSGV